MTTPIPAMQAAALTDKQIQDAVFAVLVKWKDDRAWERYTRESGPYQVTDLRREVLEIIRAVLDAAATAALDAGEPQPVAWMKRTRVGVYLRTHEAMQDTPESEDGLDRCGWEPLYASPVAAAPQGDAMDAARYRWLRGMVTSGHEDEAIEALEAANPDPTTDAEFDAAIDAAPAALSSPTLNEQGKP